MDVERLVESALARENEVFGENSPQYQFFFAMNPS
jgi:hypothetical protein